MGGPNSDECRTVYPMSNLTDYVESILGDRCQSDMIVIPTLIIYSTIFVLGLVGNICTCVVILSNKAMHNPTNFYLFSLAISDILVLVLGLPMELYQALDYAYPYTFGEYICKARAFLIEFTSYASIIIICCFSIERWLAICYPIRQKLFSTFSRAYLLILVAWVVSFVAALPMAFIVKINRLPLPDFARDQEWTHTISRDFQTVDRTDFCGMNNDEPEQQKRLIYFAFFAFFMIPALIIMLLYGHIAVKLRSADRYLQDEKPSNSERRSRSTGTVLKMLISVVVTFYLCWLPFHIQRILSVYMMNNSQEVSSAVQFLSTLVYFISGGFNVIKIRNSMFNNDIAMSFPNPCSK
ncbi:hypothetical protein WR25_14923 isoform A [Diploscapter pachys]|uniref:G-protein coupled receptors family 1 profile domain-containing protein n=1 Tax=Diploscapter pachys TaxID=2018661 RepID=A0A2A2K5U8_9BILA|nr:hypothetical protein WR25_14923 isoform A [Diploscapter pachys]